MKKLIISLALVLCNCLAASSQATSLTVDCQNPGWLSNLISYGDQLTLENIKVTGYINGTDLQFILDLNKKRSLTGVIDLENVSIVSGGKLDHYPYTVQEDEVLPYNVFIGGRKIRKIILPNTLKGANNLDIAGDTVIWTSIQTKELNICNGIGYNFDYYYLPEGIEEINQIANYSKIVFPSTLVSASKISTKGLTVYSFIKDPGNVYSLYESYYNDGISSHYSYWNAFQDCIFYVPKGTLEKYLRSNFATKDAYDSYNGWGTKNGNRFIEYYDVDSTIVGPDLTMYKGDTITLNVSIYPNDSLVSWIDYRLSNPEIVNINPRGTIVAKDYGQTEVFATPHVFIDGLETKTGACKVTVVAHSEGIEMPSSLSVHIEEEKQVEAHTLPLGYSDNQIIFSTSDSLVATVTDEGIVKGIKKGTCIITATAKDGGYTAECEITVLQPVESVFMEQHSLKMNVGESERLYARVDPTSADIKTVSWSSSDEKVAGVDNKGNVNALSAGEAWIVATSDDNAQAKDSCKLTVLQPVTGITMNYSTYQLDNIGDSFTLQANVEPADASNKNVKWKSSDESVCVVSNGQVVAVGAGTSVIIANTEDGGFMATCVVIVKDSSDISLLELTDGNFKVYDVNGMELSRMKHGINIIRFADGTKKKVVIK